MKKWIAAVACLMIVLPAMAQDMMRVSIRKSTQRIIEMQSPGDTATMMANAVRLGNPADDVEVRQVTKAQYEALFAAQPKTDLDKLHEAYAARRSKYKPMEEFKTFGEWQAHIEKVNSDNPLPK